MCAKGRRVNFVSGKVILLCSRIISMPIRKNTLFEYISSCPSFDSPTLGTHKEMPDISRSISTTIIGAGRFLHRLTAAYRHSRPNLSFRMLSAACLTSRGPPNGTLDLYRTCVRRFWLGRREAVPGNKIQRRVIQCDARVPCLVAEPTDQLPTLHHWFTCREFRDVRLWPSEGIPARRIRPDSWRRFLNSSPPYLADMCESYMYDFFGGISQS